MSQQRSKREFSLYARLIFGERACPKPAYNATLQQPTDADGAGRSHPSDSGNDPGDAGVAASAQARNG